MNTSFVYLKLYPSIPQLKTIQMSFKSIHYTRHQLKNEQKIYTKCCATHKIQSTCSVSNTFSKTTVKSRTNHLTSIHPPIAHSLRNSRPIRRSIASELITTGRCHLTGQHAWDSKRKLILILLRSYTRIIYRVIVREIIVNNGVRLFVDILIAVCL